MVNSIVSLSIGNHNKLTLLTNSSYLYSFSLYSLASYVRYTPIRNISDKEKKELYDLLDDNPDIKYRARIVLLAGEGITVPEITGMTNIYDKTIRKWNA